jgi:hypothetical protein
MTKPCRIPVWGSTNLKGIRRKKHRFPIKRDELFSFLDGSSIRQVTSIAFRLRTSREILISARYKGEFYWDRIKYYGLSVDNFHDQIGKIKIRLYSVRPEDEESAREAVLQVALPLLCEWLEEAEKQSYNWRRNDHSIVFRFKQRELSFTLDEGGHW